MGKIVAGSGGVFFENAEDPILNHIISLVDETRRQRGLRAVYLPTAGRDDRQSEETVKDYFKRHGFVRTDYLCLTDPELREEQIREIILSASVIYSGGGDTKFLLDTWRKTHADTYLKLAYDYGVVLSGVSAGAHSLFRYAYDNTYDNGQYCMLRGLDLLPYCMCPHYEDWVKFPQDIWMKELDGIGVDNDIALSFVDGTYEVVDSRRNPNHSAFYLPINEQFKAHDLQKEPMILHSPDGGAPYIYPKYC